MELSLSSEKALRIIEADLVVLRSQSLDEKGVLSLQHYEGQLSIIKRIFQNKETPQHILGTLILRHPTIHILDPPSCSLVTIPERKRLKCRSPFLVVPVSLTESEKLTPA